MAELTIADELVVAALTADLEKCLRLIQKHRAVAGRCCECRVDVAPYCRPFRLARVAAARMETRRDRSVESRRVGLATKPRP